MVRPRPESSPHFNGRINAPKPENPGEGIRRRMTGPGLFDKPVDVQPQQVSLSTELSPTHVRLETKRRILFKKGTVLYAFIKDGNGNVVIPRSRQQAEEYKRETLMFPTSLEVDEQEGIEMGKRGKPRVKKVGQSQFGAFTVVVLEKQDGNGDITKELVLASFTERALPKDNAVRRFREMNQ
jgi:hypothetical protein